MREIDRIIVSALILSKDGKMLLGKKDPLKGGVYPDCWHLPGGGVDEGEELRRALAREVEEEVGLNIALYRVAPIHLKGRGVSEKTLKTGERVICNMEFNRFEVRIDEQTVDEIELKLGGDLIEARWFTKKELAKIKQIPGGKEFFKAMGYI
jgi:8-oxo-dGTP pyrophosphatase MutT (NUDIX family)